MIQEVYVGFETAKLLKEKGFDVPINTFYNESEEFQHHTGHQKINANYAEGVIYSAPTHQMAMAWLREHNIDIIPFHEILDGDVYWCSIEKKIR